MAVTLASTKNKAIERVLKLLRANLGLGETPAGSNHNFITEWYNEHVDKIGDGPWCEMTVTWAMTEGGAENLKVPRAYTVYACKDAIDEKLKTKFHYGVKGMRKGDAVYYDWGGRKGNYALVDHVGLVEKINGDGTFYVLEGNTSNNTLRRMIRDKTYVVGYVRFNWDENVRQNETGEEESGAAEPKPTGDSALVRDIQKALEVTVDGQWGALTDARAKCMRNAARTHCGYPKNFAKPYSILTTQAIVNTKQDGQWGPKSQAHLVAWVKQFQRILGVTADGQWGPATDAKYLKVRRENLNNF